MKKKNFCVNVCKVDFIGMRCKVINYGLIKGGIFLITMVLAFYIHEAVKVMVANFYSMNNFKNKINIKKFIEPVGLILMVMFGVGWVNPTDINMLYLKNRNENRLKIYFLAIVANFILGMGIYYGMKFISIPNETIVLILFFFARSNMIVAIINFLPMYPMSGYQILMGKASPDLKFKLVNYNYVIVAISALLIFFGAITALTNFIIGVLWW
ncbi:MAG: M50 family metallopeptidase [Lachnospirales bacterium]